MRMIKDLGKIYPTGTSKQKRHYGIFECPECGSEYKTQVVYVKDGRSTKCKSCSSKSKFKTHGESKSRLYSIWGGMIKRTSNKNCSNYKYYGAKGITVCSEWKDSYESFRDWANSNGYNETLTIERNNVQGNYEPNNCSWETRTVQARNTNKLRSDNTTGYRGVSLNKKYGNYSVSIVVDKKQIHLGTTDTAEEGGAIYDNYVMDNNLEHTLNNTNLGRFK